MNIFGFAVGLITLVVIGLGFVWVIRGERHLGYLWWPYFMLAGILCVLISIFFSNIWISTLLGVTGASLIWGSTEFKEQAVRAELGWFPFHSRKVRAPFEEVIKKWKAPHL